MSNREFLSRINWWKVGSFLVMCGLTFLIPYSFVVNYELQAIGKTVLYGIWAMGMISGLVAMAGANDQ